MTNYDPVAAKRDEILRNSRIGSADLNPNNPIADLVERFGDKLAVAVLNTQEAKGALQNLLQRDDGLMATQLGRGTYPGSYDEALTTARTLSKVLQDTINEYMDNEK